MCLILVSPISAVKLWRVLRAADKCFHQRKRRRNLFPLPFPWRQEMSSSIQTSITDLSRYMWIVLHKFFYYTICGRDLQRIQSMTKRISWTPEQLRWKLLEAWRWIKRWDRPPLCKPLLRLKKKRLSIEESIQGLLQDQAEVPHMRYSVWCFPSLKSIVIGNTLMISKSYALALKYQAEVPF